MDADLIADMLMFFRSRNRNLQPAHYRQIVRTYIAAIRFIRNHPQSAEIIFQEGVEFERMHHDCY